MALQDLRNELAYLQSIHRAGSSEAAAIEGAIREIEMAKNASNTKTSYPGAIIIYFDPQPDITAFELAQIVANIGGGFPPRFGLECDPDIYRDMPPALKRHWSRRRKT